MHSEYELNSDWPIEGEMIKQPVGQVRLTNVAIIKYKIHNKKFEIACYKNKAINWRNGVETELEEVMQTNAIYANVSKGELASTEELKIYFPGVDRNKIIQTILEKGELQISEKEREVQISSVFKDIANILAEMCVHPQTKRPFSVDAIKAAMKDIHFACVLDQDTKRQALSCYKQLQKKYLIGRAEMQIQVTVPTESSAKMEEEFKASGIPAPEIRREGRSTGLIALIEPSMYREIAQFLKKEIPDGTLEILTQKVVSTEKKDLETIAMASLQIREDYKEEKLNEKRVPAEAEESDDDVKNEESKTGAKKKKGKGKGKKNGEKEVDWEEARRKEVVKKTENVLGELNPQQEEGAKPPVAPANGEEVKGTKCLTCLGAVFPTKEEYRLHFKSDWHIFNLKRKQQTGAGITFEEYTNMMLEQQMLQEMTEKKKGK